MLTLQIPRFLASHAADPDWRQAAERCLAALHPIPPQTTLGFLYATDHLASELSAILGYLKERTGVGHWVGSVGHGICASGMEYHDRPALSMMLGCLPADSFQVFGLIDDRLSDFVSQHSAWYHQHQSRFGVVHGDPRNPKLPQLIRDLAARLGDGFLVGGLTSSSTAYPQIAGGMSEGGLSGVLLGSEVQVATALSQGFTPFGTLHEINACQDNILIALDGKPALEVLCEEVGEVLARQPEQTAGDIAVALPIQGSDQGDYLVRNLLGYDRENKLLAIAEDVTLGQTIRFCRRDPESAREELRHRLRALKARAPSPPKGGSTTPVLPAAHTCSDLIQWS
ncbi:MAG: FIST signal transduction protein [Gammaproteobacteria bacterium]